MLYTVYVLGAYACLSASPFFFKTQRCEMQHFKQEKVEVVVEGEYGVDAVHGEDKQTIGWMCHVSK